MLMAVSIHEARLARKEAGLSDETTLALLRRLMNDLATLFQQEVALAKAEISQTLKRLTAGAAFLFSGAAMLFAGFLVLLAAGVLGLALVLEPWLAALIVGAAVALIGVLMVVLGLKAMNPPNLELRHSPESLRKDKDVLNRSQS
jgi:uncharacterized membrane protein YqjE